MFPGAHPGKQLGQGFAFREHESLIRAREHKRIDIHATLKNPFGEIMVRTFNQRSAIPVRVVADLSASMTTPKAARKIAVMSDAISSIAFSAYQHGDKFSLIPCNDSIDPALVMPASIDISSLENVLPMIAQKAGGGSSALPDIGRYLGTQRGLVFLISDFLYSRDILDATLKVLSRQIVVPLILLSRKLPGDRATNAIPQPRGAISGLVALVDSETGRRRKIFMRRSIKHRYHENIDRFYQDLDRYLRSNGVRPLFIEGDFDADLVNQYFHP